MTDYIRILNLEKTCIVRVIADTLKLIDQRLVDHGERVAYLATEMFRLGGLEKEMDFKTLFLLSVFHDIGAYKTDEIDKMVEFETTAVWNHSIYGYLFLKEVTSLGDAALAILHHHTDYAELDHEAAYAPYSALIFLADRIDILLNGDLDTSHLTVREGRFSPEYTQLFMRINEDGHLFHALRSGEYKQELYRLLEEIDFTVEEVLEYLKLLVYSIDFRSEHTVAHTINTTAISVEIGCRMGLDETTLAQIYYGAFLHDIGKIAIPLDILEFAGRLSDEQMEIMKTHVLFTEKIVSGLVSPEICRIAVRHHEKLDGSGYPHGLHGDELTLPEEIVAVADIVSALTSRRSYKDVFPKEKTLTILKEMQQSGKLSPAICAIVLRDYDEIMRITDATRDPVIQLYNSISREYEALLARYPALTQLVSVS